MSIALYSAVSLAEYAANCAASAVCCVGDIAQAGLQTLIDGVEQSAGLGVAIDEIVDLGGNAVRAAEQLADRREARAQGVAELGVIGGIGAVGRRR